MIILKDVQFTFRLSENDLKLLKAKASAVGMSLSEFLRELIRRF